MPDPRSRDLWEDIAALSAWLHRHNGASDEQVGLHLLHLNEEIGEACQAYLGWRGHNPRKGVTHTQGDVRAELADVVIGAMNALVLASGGVEGAREALNAKIDAQHARIADTRESRLPPKGMKVPPQHDDRAERMANDAGPYFEEAYARARRHVRGQTDA